ncbi:MAG: c-type cytochrome [Pirellulaceae bacterium]|nr:c-type cytochrome [Pirellulaceae bacterium]
MATEEPGAADTSSPDASATPAEPAEPAVPAEPAAPAEPEKPAEPASEPEKPAEPAAEPPAPAAEPSAAKPVDASQVLLGSPELTAGIPGEGPLTVEQIQEWLDRPENHLPLKPILPLGLSLAQGQVTGLDANPMTRAKIELGRQLYFDRRLSSDATVSCADCHHPDEGYGRRTQFGVGVNGQTGNRNSPVSYNRIITGAQFWDGRAASLEEQAKGPIANPIEMSNTHEAAIETIKGIEGYRLQFEKIFGGEPTIDHVAAAIATFERAIVSGPSAYDYFEPLRVFRVSFKDDLEDLDALKEDDPDLYNKYMELVKASEAHPISESAIRGRELFFSQKVGCTACHAGANFTDEKYHNLGVGMDAAEPDLGRYEVTKQDVDRGAFKTPTVRNVVHSAPYMHDGSQKTLEEVVEWYNKGGHPNPHLSKDVKKLELTDQDKKDLVEFMKALTGDFPKVETGRLPQ